MAKYFIFKILESTFLSCIQNLNVFYMLLGEITGSVLGIKTIQGQSRTAVNIKIQITFIKLKKEGELTQIQ